MAAEFLCGESRSGPDPSKQGQHALRKDGHAAGRAVLRGESPAGCIASTRFEGDPGLCSWIELVADIGGRVRRCFARAGSAGHASDGRRSGLGKHAAFGEATGGDGPGTSPHRWGVKSRQPESGERDRGRQKQGHDLPSRSTTPGRGSAARRARDHEPLGPSGLSSPGNRGRSCTHAEARGSPSSEARLDHAPVKVSTGRAAWKLRSPAKAERCGDSRADRSVECSCRASVADVG